MTVYDKGAHIFYICDKREARSPVCRSCFHSTPHHMHRDIYGQYCNVPDLCVDRNCTCRCGKIVPMPGEDD